MKMISTLAAGAALSAMVATGALASDLNGGSVKDSVVSSGGGLVNWTGFYVGGAVGYGNANHNLSMHEYFKDYCGDSSDADEHGFDDPDRWERADFLVNGVLTCKTPGEGVTRDDVVVGGDSREVGNLDGLNSSGIVGDVRVGYDHAFGRFLVGAYALYGFGDMSTSAGAGGTDINLIENGDEWSVGVRAGLIVAPRTMAYVLAAYTEQEWSFAGIGPTGGNKEITFSGFTVGGGVEFALARNVFFGIEGTHTFLGEETLVDSYDLETNSGSKLNDEIGVTEVMGTLKIKLNSGDLRIGD